MRRSKKRGGNCNDLLAAIAPCKYLLSAVIPLKNVDINADVGRLISSRACDELAVNLSNRVNSEVLQDKSISIATDNTEAVDYLYINSRGGYKKMAKGGSSSGIGGSRACNTCMKGGCFTCNKGKRKLNAYYKEIIIIIPVLYAKYKQFDKKKGKKMKGGYGSFMENIMNVTNLSFEYKPFRPVNFSDQLLDI